MWQETGVSNPFMLVSTADQLERQDSANSLDMAMMRAASPLNGGLRGGASSSALPSRTRGSSNAAPRSASDHLDDVHQQVRRRWRVGYRV